MLIQQKGNWQKTGYFLLVHTRIASHKSIFSKHFHWMIITFSYDIGQVSHDGFIPGVGLKLSVLITLQEDFWWHVLQWIMFMRRNINFRWNLIKYLSNDICEWNSVQIEDSASIEIMIKVAANISASNVPVNVIE